MLHTRPAEAHELSDLNALCLRSKAVWGYDEAFMAACEDELRITEDDLHQRDMVVAEQDNKVVGLAQVMVDQSEAELTMMFVEPDCMKSGVGRVLFEWACDTAREKGATSILIDSDPFAAPFYRHMGACDIGLAPSGSIPGRMLPMLTYRL